MLGRALAVLVVIAATLFVAGCGGATPTEPNALGQIHFIDSGCACTPPPYPGIPIYVDGKVAGTLPVFGELTLSLSPGTHTWSADSAGAGTSVLIQAGGTTTVQIFTNLNCVDGCADGASASRP
jgi:hypothetical protein